MKISNYRDKKAHVNKIINSNRKDYDTSVSQKHKIALCITEIGDMLLEDMTVKNYVDGQEKITSIDAAQYSVSDRKASKAFEGMAETMRFEGQSHSAVDSIL